MGATLGNIDDMAAFRLATAEFPPKLDQIPIRPTLLGIPTFRQEMGCEGVLRRRRYCFAQDD